ncbi:MAG TPA: ubiquinol oxidase subunit II [Candidatus Saccharimonadales bacterium]
MNKKTKIISVLAAVLAVILLASYYFSHHVIAVLTPMGPIAQKERNLMLVAGGLMLIVVIPVFVITFYIVYKYRDGHKGKYRPDFDHSAILETTWWLIPSALILILSVITWRASYQLDPYKPIASSTKPISIEVVALTWKWLFIYPQQNIASVNLMQIPVNTPVNLYLTADAPMNSFWVPQLSGQIYAMPGMSTQLHLMATSQGSYYGSSANISGNGFAGMHFMTNASSTAQFNNWVANAKSAEKPLNYQTYALLSQPSENNRVSFYNSTQPNIYSSIINKYMAPGMQMSSTIGSTQ